MRMNPVLESERRRSMRNMKYSWIIFAVNLVLILVVTVIYLGTGGRENYVSAGQYTYPIQCYMLMAYVLFVSICVLVPGIAGGSIALERDRKTLDILLTTYLNPCKIVIGKLESSLCLIFLVAFSALPVMALVLVYGGVSLPDLFLLVAILVVSGVFVGSIGIFCSAVCKKTTTATILAYVIVFFLVVGTLALLFGVHYIMEIQQELSGNFDKVQMGGMVYLLCLNPLVIYFCLLSRQIGSGSEFLDLCNILGNYNHSFGVNHMLWLALAVQMLVSVFLLFFAGRAINPLKKGYNR